MPQASIIVPAYNAAKTLRATLESLLAQTFEDFEIVPHFPIKVEKGTPPLNRHTYT